MVDDIKLGGTASTLEDNIRIQNCLNKLENWSEVSMMKFNKDKCKVLYLERKNQMHEYKMGNNWVGSNTAEKDMGVIIDPKLNEPTMGCNCKKGKCLSGVY